MSKHSHPQSPSVFDSVLYLGPDIAGHGGMASLLAAYKRELPVFHFLPTNSPRGTLPGLAVLAKTLVRIPLERMRGRRIAHIHFTMQKSWPRKKVVAAWCKLLGYKVVMHCHSSSESMMAKGKAMGRVLNRYDHTIVLANHWQKLFRSELGCQRTSIVPNIVVPLKPSPFPACDSEHPFTFLFLAVLADNKGIWELIEACSRLRDSEANSWRLLVAGSGNVDRLKELIARYNLEDKVEYIGWLSGDGKSDAMSRAHAVILPSHREGQPITVLEGLSAQRGVIATPVGGVPEVIDNGVSGLLVEVGNVDQIAAAMQHYIDHPAKAAEHGRAGSQCIANFTPATVERLLEEIYKSL